MPPSYGDVSEPLMVWAPGKGWVLEPQQSWRHPNLASLRDIYDAPRRLQRFGQPQEEGFPSTNTLTRSIPKWLTV